MTTFIIATATQRVQTVSVVSLVRAIADTLVMERHAQMWMNARKAPTIATMTPFAQIMTAALAVPVRMATAEMAEHVQTFMNAY